MIIKGQKINDRYQIIRTVGEGGMANVYLAYDTILDRNVAVKILRGDLANDEKFVRRFQREAIAASSLTHPNIVEMYDVGEDDGKYFIVMEYVEGTTLKTLIKRRGALTLAEVLDIMKQLTAGLGCAHESFIIHRDIKAQNVLILDDGRVKITDFGIAMALNSNELTQTNSVMGSVHYLPPEQASGTGSTVQSDIYSLGILMYELLTGKLPFKGESAVEIAIKQMKNRIPSVRELNPLIPQSIENIILKACAKNPKNRYENVMDMNKDLQEALDEDKKEQPKLVYEFKEVEDEQPKKKSRFLKNKNKTAIKTEEKDLEKTVYTKKDKIFNRILIATGIVTVLIAIVMLFILYIYPIIKSQPDIKVPNVTNMSVVEAEQVLLDEGFTVATETTEDYSETVDEGLVIRTNPISGRTLKKGSEITIVVSIGSQSMILDDYTDQDYDVVKKLLESHDVVVAIDYEEHPTSDELEEGKIVAQSIEAGEKIMPDDIITFTVIKNQVIYPDFLEEDYSIEGIQNFCDDNGVTLEITYVENDIYADGTIISQSRAAGVKVVSGVVLRIEVTKKPEVTEPVDDETIDETPTEEV